MSSNKERYENAFEREPVKDEEYEAYINTLKTIKDTQAKEVFKDFIEFEKAAAERDRFYYHFTREQQSEALDTFKTDLL